MATKVVDSKGRIALGRHYAGRMVIIDDSDTEGSEAVSLTIKTNVAYSVGSPGSATVTIVDQTGAPATGVEVKGTWSFENTAASCRTDTAGKCSMYRSGLPTNVDSVTITVTAPQNAAKSIRREGVN